MKLSTIVVILLIVTGVVVGTYHFVNELAEPAAFNVGVNQTYVNGFNKTIELNNELNRRYQEIQNLSANTGSAFQIITLIPDVLIIAKNSLALPFVTSYELVNNFVEFLGLPVWVFNLLLGLVAALLIYAFITLVLGRQA